jgi:hypothetical protein
MQLLKDSVHSGYVAVMILGRLIPKQTTGRKHQAHHQSDGRSEHRSTLETSILVDRSSLPRGVCWNKQLVNFECGESAISQKWALESAIFSLLDISVKYTGILDTHNSDGLATEWRPVLGVRGVGSQAGPLVEVETERQQAESSLRVLISN